MHPKYGRQFAIHCWAPWAPDGESALRFLHECVDGFLDYNLTRTICDHFEEGTFAALAENPKAVLALAEPDHLAMPGQIKHSSMSRALVAWDRLRTTYELLGVLQDQGLTAQVIKDVFVRFGHDAKDIVSKNPYRLLEIRGFSMQQADRIAARMGLDLEDPRRTQGAVLATLRAATTEGHVFVKQGDFPMLFPDVARDARVSAFPTRPSRVNTAVEGLAAEGAVVVDGEAVYLPEYFRYEREAATMLAEFLTPVQLEVEPLAFLDEYERSHRIDLSNAQKEAVEKLLTSRVLVLTGLPGTGKTTVVKTFVNLFQAAGLSFRQMAPTGIAAKRMASVTGKESATIHRTFGYDGETWAFNRANKYTIDAVIIDEMSMVDIELFFRILDALHPSTILVFVGDDAQLPSVGPGNVLRELLACPAIPNVRLTQIFRQSAKGGIVTNSHRINGGESLDLDEKDPTSEFRFIPLENEEKAAHLIVEMAAKLKARDANFQVLSPKYEGSVGVDALNTQMRDKLNPAVGQPEWAAGDFSLREGDRVMVVKNDYQLGIYNGDMAKVNSFSREDVVIKIHGIGPMDVDTYVRVPKSEAPYKLCLAYAVTVHKSQGSEWETVILPIARTQRRMLQRNLLYTAVTRAKKKLWLIGHADAVGRAIANDMVVQRNTMLARAIAEAQAAVVAAAGGVRCQVDNERTSDTGVPANAG
jgi:exodeoxyribonuclease V alpha subunit